MKTFSHWNKLFVFAMVFFYLALAMVAASAYLDKTYLPEAIAAVILATVLMAYAGKQMRNLLTEEMRRISHILDNANADVGEFKGKIADLRQTVGCAANSFGQEIEKSNIPPKHMLH